MKRNKIIYDRWLRVLFLSFALLVGGGGWMAWGQTDDRPSIKLQYDLNKHDSVFVDTKVIYVVPNRERVLFIPELRISLQTTHDRYNWYVHWYIKGKNGSNPQGQIAFKEFQTTKDEATNQGGDFIESSYTTENDFVKANCSDGGLVWSARLKEHFPNKVKRYGTDASTISYTMSNNSYTDGDTIYCDVSIYRDGNISGDDSSEDAIYTEPTLTKRTKYIIKNAQECITKIENKEIEEFKFDYPAERTAVNFDGRKDNKNKSLNFSMPSLPNNYFWKKSDGTIVQGNQFEYKVVNGKTSDYKVFGLVTRPGNIIPFQQTQRLSLDDYPTEGEDIEVIVRATDQNGNKSGELAKFIFHPLQGVGFELEKNIKDKDERFPRRNRNKYRRVGWVNFDLGEPVNELNGKSSNDNNIATEPFGFFKDNHTTYGFFNKKVSPLLTKVTWGTIREYVSTSNQNIYGLFRSANVKDKTSENLTFIKEENWHYRYTWIPATGSDNDKNQYTSTPLYDRTYHISQDPKDPINAGKEENELTPQYGHFYYIDASNEPGTIVKIPIDGTICFNTEITVTAWLADMTRASLVDKTEVNRGKYPLAPNINIYLIGKNKDEEDVVIHRFTSGDALVDYSETTANSDYFDKDGTTKAKRNKNLMQWQQLYYSFVLQHNVEYENYYLEIQNNEPHTDGADYAIDDIRIFKTIPDIQVVQTGDPCDEKIKTVKFKSNYNMLLANFGLTADKEISNEAGSPLTYADFDKLPETHLLKKYLTSKYKSKNEIEEALKYFTTVYYAIYEVSDQIDKEGRPVPKNTPIKIAYGNEEQTYRTSYLSTRLEDMAWTTWSEESSSSTYKTEDGYITSANVSINGELTANKTYVARVSETPISGECVTCSFYNSFVLEGVGDRVMAIQDGKNVDIKDIEPGESVTVTGILKYNPDENSDELVTCKDPVFDWFLGTWDEFIKPEAITVNSTSYSIMEALMAAFNDRGSSDTEKSNIKTALEKKYGVYSESNLTGRLIFGVESFNFTIPTDKTLQWGVMLPRTDQAELKDQKAVICSDPHEFLLGGTPPTIDPGDPDVPDPEDPDPDDPEDPDPKDPEDPNTPQPDENPFDGSHVRSVRVGLVQIQDMHSNNGTLRIPIHARTSLENEKFVMTNDKNILVYKTSDTNWDKTKVIGTLHKLVDNKEKNVEWRENYFRIQFDENATKKFKEGFWYMVGIPYKVVDRNNNSDKPYGDRVFMLTLKIVPEYVTWVGNTKDMHNWNNDGSNHWRRSNDGELYTTNIANANGTHDNAYTPMRFTKVTVADNGATPYSAYPYLYELKKNTGNQTKDPKNVLLNMAPASMDATIGAATRNIEYDLLADPDYEQELFGNVQNPDKKDNPHSYSCVRFYGNTCDDIYIKPQSEILHTEYLTYDTAHVDYEMEPNRWYMLASPLKGVVSGDMYLPTGTGSPKVGSYARQETPAFDKINYDNTNYTRWKPAVYMRGWDKATATIVRPDGSTKVNYGIKGGWSNLYNDVDVPFTPGTGFSIGTKTDVTTTLTNNKVLFRLPKADMKYIYYGSTSGSGDETSLKNRTGNGRFYISPDDKGQNTVTSCPISSTGGMFGNPFMSHLDMAKFLNGKSTNTYYIMTATGTTAHILGDEYSISTGDVDPKYVAPLQSFIVKDLTSATFTTDMIAKAPATGKPGLRSATSSPADEPLPQLRITATRDGVRNTAVVAGLVTASDSYVEGEDAALLINEDVAAPQVYTLAGNQMTAINVTPELNKIPVGIHSKDATPVELSFKVSGAMQNVTLVDKQAGKSYPVTDNLTLTVPGNTSGRYFLNGSIVTSNEIVAQNRIIFYSSTNGRIDISSTDPLTKITVYDISGRQIRVLNHINAPVAAIEYLRPGIYLVQAESITQTVTEKVDVK